MNLLDLFVKISVQDEASENVETLSGKFKNGLATAAKVGAAAVGAAATGIAVLTKNALNNYAEYEQLVGGVDTLFKDSSAKVQEYASNAYKTAGLSANEYMDTVTSFSASLLQSLGGDTAAAADMANVAITDMSDNANKMGTDMASIQNAYQGFAKQNYTMLDNLKLGYGGTKEEMERLLENATKLSGVEYDISSYADIVDAIHVIQGEMEISGRTAEEAAAIYERTGRQVSEQLGTTAKEASTTIQGSVSSMKSAWGNLLVGIADDNADFKTLTEQFVNSLVTVGENIIPRVKVILQGITNLISQASQSIIPLVLQTLIEAVPSLLSAGIDLVMALVNGISSNISSIATCIMDIISVLLEKLAEALPQLLVAGVNIILGLVQGLIEGIPALIDSLPTIITALVNGILGAIPQIIQAGINLLTALVGALPEIIQAIINAIPLIIDGIINAIVQSIPLIIQAGIDLLMALIGALPEIITAIVAAIPQIVSGITDALIGNIDKIIDAGVQLFVALIENLPKIIIEIVKAVPDIIAGIVKAFGDLAWKIVEVGGNLIKGIWQGIKDAGAWLKEKITGFFDGVVGGIKDFLGIHSPSKVFAKIGGFMAEGLGDGFDDQFKSVKKDIENSMSFDAGTITADANISKHYTSGSYGLASTSGGGDSGRIVMLLEQYLPMLANMKVIMDSGQVVGLLAPGMDEELAKINARRARAV